MDIYRKKQQWDAASVPDPVILHYGAIETDGFTSEPLASVPDVRSADTCDTRKTSLLTEGYNRMTSGSAVMGSRAVLTY